MRFSDFYVGIQASHIFFETSDKQIIFESASNFEQLFGLKNQLRIDSHSLTRAKNI